MDGPAPEVEGQCAQGSQAQQHKAAADLPGEQRRKPQCSRRRHLCIAPAT